uniref:Uncharacterized protein n=1 Tax=Arundo donax TaxID=35708 RepID=A0A0A9FQC5_ARUDO
MLVQQFVPRQCFFQLDTSISNSACFQTRKRVKEAKSPS